MARLRRLTPADSRVAVFFYCFAVLLHNVCAASLDDWRSRTIYQVLTDRYSLANGSTTQLCSVDNGLYCGGSWKGIENRLDYIQGMNFDAIWISPIVAQLPQETADGEAYTAYWQQDLYALNDRFGTVDDLHDLISAVHQRGMYLMLDIVVNHFGYAGAPDEIDYAVFNPFNDSSYFHEYCPINSYTNQTNVEVCWLGDTHVSLVDLRTEDSNVQSMYGNWIRDLVANYSIDGLRIDSSINVNSTFFPDFVDASGIFATGEVMTANETLACNWASTIGSILNYPVYYPLVAAFSETNGSISDLTEMLGHIQANCANPTALGIFSESHDVPRFAHMNSDMALAQNVITYTILSDGIPIVYQGQEQHMKGGISPFYTNRAPLWDTDYDQDAPLYKLISTLVLARKHVIASNPGYISSNSEVIYQDYHTFAIRKGLNGSQVITVLTNDGAHADEWVISLEKHGLPAGAYVAEILSCEFFVVNETGFLNVPMGQGQPKILLSSNLITNSSLCGFTGAAIPTATVITAAYATTITGNPTVITAATTKSISVDVSSTTSAAAASSTHHSGSIPHRKVDALALAFGCGVAMICLG